MATHYKVHRTVQVGSNYIVNGLAYSDVPSGDNQAGIPWTTVAAEYQAFRRGRWGDIELYPISQTIEDALTAGTVFSWEFSASIPTSATPAQAVTALEQEITNQLAAKTAYLSEILRYWGHEGDL